MDAWGYVVGVLGAVAVGFLLMSLAWAALERGRIHHRLARQRRGASKPAAAHLEGWRVERLLGGLREFARRAGRIHLAAGAVAGWV